MRKMKDSGIEWIGDIPEGWEVRKIKTFSPVLRGASPRPIDDPQYFDENGKYSWVRISDVSAAKKYLYSAGDKLSKIGESKSVKIHAGDLFVSICASVGKACISEIDCCIHDGFVYFPSLDKRMVNFLYYIFTSGECYSGLGKLGTQLNLNTNTVSDIYIPFLSIEHCVCIADYLDAKCARIDESMELVRQSMEKLRAYKLSLITEAVTKGLDPDVPMKDSGIPWIGEIPKGWKISVVRWEFDNLDGKRKPVSAENRTSANAVYDYYGASGVIDKIDDFIFDEPLILIGEDGANLALRNLPLIYVATGKYWVNNHAHILKPTNNNHLYYMAYQLECVDLVNYITGSTQPKLTQSNLSKIPVVCPPLSEQQRIADYLDARCARIDTLLEEKERLLDRLAEYKKSLIFECVTGKREVSA